METFYVFMLLSQTIQLHVPQRCIFPRFSRHDILLNINGSFRKAKYHRMSPLFIRSSSNAYLFAVTGNKVGPLASRYWAVASYSESFK